MYRFFFLLSKGIKDLGINKGQQAVTLLGLTLVLFLGLLILLSVYNLQEQVLAEKGRLSFQVYWESTADEEKVQKQWESLREREDIASVTTYTQEEALQSLESGLGDMDLQWLESDNPLPATAIVHMDLPEEAPEAAAREMIGDIEAREGVQRVSMSMDRLREAGAWSRISGTLFYPLAGGLIFLIGLMMANTFKLTLYNKREEVEVLWLVGAGRWFIQLPVLVGAVFQSFVAGAIALGLVGLTCGFLNELLHVPPIWIQLRFFPPEYILMLFGGLLVVSILSSWAAIREF